MRDRTASDYCYSLRLVQPIMDYFSEELAKRSPDERIPAEVVHTLIDTVLEFLDDIRPSIAAELRSKSQSAKSMLPGPASYHLCEPNESSYSLAQVKPFALQFVDDFKTLDSDARISIALAHKLLDAVVDAANDPDFGLKAGRSISASDIGALGYAMNSASSVREAIEVAARYIRLINDGLVIRLEVEGEKAFLKLESQVVLPRSAEDFLLSSFYRNHASGLKDLSKVECWFIHAEPRDTVEYRRTFEPSVVRFAAPCCAIVFDKQRLEDQLESADSKLLTVLRKHADQMLSELPKIHNLADKVRALIAAELPHGQPRIAKIAHKMSMSSRTLERKLENDGTTFTSLLNDLRRGLAEKYVLSRDLSLSEVAFLLGFSHSAAFHRAFKRWTGQTPLIYRRTYRK